MIPHILLVEHALGNVFVVPDPGTGIKILQEHDEHIVVQMVKLIGVALILGGIELQRDGAQFLGALHDLLVIAEHRLKRPHFLTGLERHALLQDQLRCDDGADRFFNQVRLADAANLGFEPIFFCPLLLER